MVHIRDVDTWKWLPGVRSGDLGPKVGYNSKDNGWATFDQVRVPRENMLMGVCELSREGNFKVIGDLRTLYTVMMHIRVMIIKTSAWHF